MRHGHPQYGELVGLARQRRARGHHVRQLRDVGRHLVAAAALDLAVVLPATTHHICIQGTRDPGRLRRNSYLNLFYRILIIVSHKKERRFAASRDKTRFQ